MPNHTPLWKIAATIGGAGLTASAVWLNAEHVALAEGWGSPLVVAGVIVTLCAAGAPPAAERAAKTGQPLKAVHIWVFFAVAVGFSLSNSIARSSSYSEAKAASTVHANEIAKLADEAYRAAKQTQAEECKKRGPRCRGAEEAVAAARTALATAAPMQITDPGAERLAAVLRIEKSTVQLYALLPLSLELGGFIFLAAGLAPRRREDAIAPVAMPEPATAKPAKREAAAVAKLMQAVATAKLGAVGTRGYYLARLESEAPDLAKRVHGGDLSVYAASVAAGFRKAAAKWTKADRLCAESHRGIAVINLM